MGIEPTPNIFERMLASERKKFGRRGLTKEESLHRETSVLERKIHDEFTSFCNRHSLDVWHSSPVRRSSIGTGLPDFHVGRNNRWLTIEFKVFPNKLSLVQESRIALMRARGNDVYICTETPENSACGEAMGIASRFFNLFDEPRTPST